LKFLWQMERFTFALRLEERRIFLVLPRLEPRIVMSSTLMLLGYEIIPLLIFRHSSSSYSFPRLLLPLIPLHAVTQFQSYEQHRELYTLRPDRSHLESWPSRLTAVFTFVLRHLSRLPVLRVLYVQQVLFLVWECKNSATQRLVL